MSKCSYKTDDAILYNFYFINNELEKHVYENKDKIITNSVKDV